MKRTKQIDAYYCDYCGKECEHTPEFVLPVLFPSEERGRRTINPVKKDVCPECQKKIAALLGLTDRVIFRNSNPRTTIITF